MVSTNLINNVFTTVLSYISNVSNTVLISVLGFVGLLIAAGVSYRLLKRHIGQPIGGAIPRTAMRLQANRRYTNLTDDRSERGDFLHEGK